MTTNDPLDPMIPTQPQGSPASGERSEPTPEQLHQLNEGARRARERVSKMSQSERRELEEAARAKIEGRPQHSASPRGQQQEWKTTDRGLDVGSQVLAMSAPKADAIRDAHNAELAAEREKTTDAQESFEESELLRRNLVNELESERNPNSDGTLAFHLANTSHELTAESQRCEQADKERDQWRKDFTAIVEDRRQLRQQLQRELLPALAAIEKVDFDADLVVGALDSLGLALANHEHAWTNGEHAIYEQSLKVLWNMSEQIRALKSVNLSALHEHDAELTEKVRAEASLEIKSLKCIEQVYQQAHEALSRIGVKDEGMDVAFRIGKMVAKVREPLVEALRQIVDKSNGLFPTQLRAIASNALAEVKDQ